MDRTSTGLENSAVALTPDKEINEFAAPLGPKALSNLLVLGAGQFGLHRGDAIDSLEQGSPATIDPNGTGMAAKQYFVSVAPNGANGLDPATIYRVTPTQVNGVIVYIPLIYAFPAQLGLQTGDDIVSLCVIDDGDGIFNPAGGKDQAYFTISRQSASVQAGFFNSGDILASRPAKIGQAGPTFVGITTRAATLGLKPTDQISALKCYRHVFCDVDLDGTVDKTDIQLIFNARGQTAAPEDPRDYNADGVITIDDARGCALLCTKPNCQ